MRNGAGGFASGFPRLDEWRQQIAPQLATLLADIPHGTVVFKQVLPLDRAAVFVYLLSEAHYDKVKTASDQERWQELVPDKHFNMLTGEISLKGAGAAAGAAGAAGRAMVVSYAPRPNWNEGGAKGEKYGTAGDRYGRDGGKQYFAEEEQPKHAPGPGAGQPHVDLDAPLYTCEYDCGFIGYFEEVQNHEAFCPRRGNTAQARPDAQEPRAAPGEEHHGEPDWGAAPGAAEYKCAFDNCNFRSSYREVQLHEETCPKRTGAPAQGYQEEPVPEKEPPVETSAPGAPAGHPGDTDTSQHFEATSLYDFTPAVFKPDAGEEILFFRAGMTVQVVDKDEEGNWWFGSIQGPSPFGTLTQGWFPTEYVRRNR